jgi:putative drug exporter of the RND superfamily
MATRLYRIGGWAFENRRKVLAGWLLVLVAVFASAAMFSGKTSNEFSVPGTESQVAQDLLQEKFPEAGGGSARVVFAAPEGEKLTDPDNKAAVMESVENASRAPEVSAVQDPYSMGAISKDGRIGFADVYYPVKAEEVEKSSADALEASTEPATRAGMQVEFGGGVVTEESQSKAEMVGLLVGFLVLAMTLGSLLAAGLPLLTAILGVGLGTLGITALSGAVEISETAPILASMLGLAVGIDYALFILSRHRQNLHEGMAPRESAAQATATAGSAVVFAGATVVIALVGLVVVNIPFLTVMGLAAAVTVSLAVLIAVTLLPAVMGFSGGRLGRLNRLLVKRPRHRAEGAPTLSLRYVRLITRRPLLVVIATVALLGAIAIPALHMKLGLPDDGASPTSSTERRAYDLLTEGFGPGFNGPLTAVVYAPDVPRDKQKELAQGVADEIKTFPGVAAVSEPAQNEAGDITVVSVTPKSGPASDGTKDLVSYMRDEAAKIPESYGIEAYVTGQTAMNIDTNDKLAAALPKYIAVVVGLALILLMVVFRSVLVPIKAVGGFLLSIAASLGLVVWVFQDGNLNGLFDVAKAGPITSFLPVLLVGILFGLAMDYEVFLVSRMRENFVRSGRARESVVKGYSQSGRVVTAAAIIMVSVFGAFVTDTDPVVKSIGLSLAVGVLADAFVVRMTLVPAAMALLGRRAWWMPKRLERWVPDVDIEGEAVTHGLRGAAS